MSQRSAVGRADFQHQYFAAYLLAPILLILALAALQRIRSWRGQAASTPFVALLFVVAGVAALTFLWIPDLLNSRIDSVIGYRPRVAAAAYADPQADVVAMRVLSVRDAVGKRVRRNEPIYDFSNQPALYFFADRKNATRFYQVPIASPLRYQKEVIKSLAAARPRIVLRGSPEGFDRFDGIANETRAPHIARFIDEHYAFETSVRGIELWSLRPGAMSNAPLSMLVPKNAPAESANRLVFPSIGNVRGAGDSFWKSDLTIFNPFEDPITVRLRYLGTSGNTDRSVTVAPGTTLRLRDVVASLFQRGGSRGACIVRYVEGRRPIVSLQSYDSAHGSSSSTELPLDSSSSAVGGTKRDHLVISGVEENSARRVNVGLLNVGDAPVLFELFARGADGGRIGHPLEGSLAEGESLLLVSASRELGVEIDGSSTIVVHVKSGQAVGYASMIDGLTGTQSSIPATPVTRP
jgi:hypothetical protein